MSYAISTERARCHPSVELPMCRHCTRRCDDDPLEVELRREIVIDAASVARCGICCMFNLRLPEPAAAPHS